MIHLCVALFSCISSVVTPCPCSAVLYLYESDVRLVHDQASVLHYSTHTCPMTFIIYDPLSMRQIGIFVICPRSHARVLRADRECRACACPTNGCYSYSWAMTQSCGSRRTRHLNKDTIQSSAPRGVPTMPFISQIAELAVLATPCLGPI